MNKLEKLPVINLFGGPGCGKSTTAALIFGKLKQLGYNVEMAREFVKEKVWEQSFNVLSDQLYILGKQNHKIHVLQGQCDAAITDSPLILCSIYNKNLKKLDDMVIEAFNQYHNINYVIERSKRYNPSGRMQTEEDAVAIDLITVNTLERFNLPYKTVPYGDEGVMLIVHDFVRFIEKLKEMEALGLGQ